MKPISQGYLEACAFKIVLKITKIQGWQFNHA